MEKIYDIAIVGGGPGGYSAAIRAAQLGAKVVLVEKNTIGGTCLNIGCIPTKCILESAALIEKINKNIETGLLKDAGLFSWKKIQEQKNATVKKLTSGVGVILESYGVVQVKGKAVINKAGRVIVDGKEYQTKNIIIATGSKVYMPEIEGVKGNNVITSTEALSLPKVPRTMVIIGGGAIGLEFASIYNTLGTTITVIEMMEEIISNEDKEIVAILKAGLVKRGIRFVTSATVEKIEDKNGLKNVSFTKNGKNDICTGEFVLVSVGRVPNTDGIEIEGLEKDKRGSILVNSRQETNIPRIYAVGDVTGKVQLAHAAYAEAEVAASNCMGNQLEVDLSIMPRCIYSIPQYAAVGKTEEQVKREGIEYMKVLLPYATNGKALAANETVGTVKMIARKTDGCILGAHIVGGYATELLSGAIVAINMGATIDNFEKFIFPHPTMSELIKEAVLAIDQRAIHIPKSKIALKED